MPSRHRVIPSSEDRVANVVDGLAGEFADEVTTEVTSSDIILVQAPPENREDVLRRLQNIAYDCFSPMLYEVEAATADADPDVVARLRPLPPTFENRFANFFTSPNFYEFGVALGISFLYDELARLFQLRPDAARYAEENDQVGMDAILWCAYGVDGTRVAYQPPAVVMPDDLGAFRDMAMLVETDEPGSFDMLAEMLQDADEDLLYDDLKRPDLKRAALDCIAGRATKASVRLAYLRLVERVLFGL